MKTKPHISLHFIWKDCYNEHNRCCNTIIGKVYVLYNIHCNIYSISIEVIYPAVKRVVQQIIQHYYKGHGNKNKCIFSWYLSLVQYENFLDFFVNFYIHVFLWQRTILFADVHFNFEIFISFGTLMVEIEIFEISYYEYYI